MYVLPLLFSMEIISLEYANVSKMLLFKLPIGRISRSVSVLLLAVSQPSVPFYANGSDLT